MTRTPLSDDPPTGERRAERARAAATLLGDHGRNVDVSELERSLVPLEGLEDIDAVSAVAVAHGLDMPEGVGAALGFDRLVMLAAGADSIDAVRCFSSRNA